MRKLTGKFEMYLDGNDVRTIRQWRWRLIASNGQIIATSGEGYTTLRACENGISSLRWNAPFAKVEVLT